MPTLITAGQVKRNLPMLEELERQRNWRIPNKSYLVTISVESEIAKYVITETTSDQLAINLALYKCARQFNRDPRLFSKLYRKHTRISPL